VELSTRRVIWFAVTDHPDAAWVTQQARNVGWELSQLGLQARFLIHDHDAKYGGGSDLRVRGAGVGVIRTPIAALRANSLMERQIGSTRRECLDWLLILNRRHLEPVLTERLEHDKISRRELSVLSHVAAGQSNKQIGKQLGISQKTVRNHLSRIFHKLRANHRTEAVTNVRLGLLII
jgi:putative transposase